MKRTNNEFIDEVAEIVAPMLAKYGFELKKRGHFEKQAPNNNTFSYGIGVHKKFGLFYLGLGFGVKNKQLMKKVNEVFEALYLERAKVIAINPDLIKQIKKNHYIFSSYPSIWRDYRQEGESLEEFWQRIRILIEGVEYSIKELDNWYAQLQETVDIVGKFSSATVDNQWIIDNTGFPALYMLKKEGVDEETFQKGLEKARDVIICKEDIKDFIRHLDNIDFSDDK